MKLLTVCIPCYNSIMEMHKAINSCLLMKDEVEVLIVDRHSHDETLQVAKALKYFEIKALTMF